MATFATAVINDGVVEYHVNNEAIREYLENGPSDEMTNMANLIEAIEHARVSILGEYNAIRAEQIKREVAGEAVE